MPHWPAGPGIMRAMKNGLSALWTSAVVVLVAIPIAIIATGTVDRNAGLVPVGDSAALGPMTIRVKQAVSTATPHTYVLTMSIRNRGARAVPFPSVILRCKAPTGPAGYGLTGAIMIGDSLAAHETRAGDLTIYPNQICEHPRVTFARRRITGPEDQVTYSLSGLI
jgi:hypothetical protein